MLYILIQFLKYQLSQDFSKSFKTPKNGLIFDFLVLGDTGIKLLGVPALPHKSSESAGDLISKATSSLFEIYRCRDNIKYMVFDTTSANTGRKTKYDFSL